MTMTGALLTKHQTVLHWYESTNRDRSYPEDRESFGPQYFVAERPVSGQVTLGTIVKIDYDVWQDMGAPIDLTVTIETGDRLNP